MATDRQVIVGDPQTIPHRFRLELEGLFAVGLVHFGTLGEHAQYAYSVATSERHPAPSALHNEMAACPRAHQDAMLQAADAVAMLRGAGKSG